MTFPIYNPNTPEKPSDSLADSQPDFLDNFRAIYQAFLVNHVSLDAASGAGNHTFIQLLSDKEPFQTNVSEISIFSKPVDDQTDQLFLRYQGNGQEVQLTNYQLYSLDSSNPPTKFFTFLTGKIIVYFGTTTISNSPANLVLNLLPGVARNIITMDFCPLGTTPNFKPVVTVSAAEDGFFKKINFVGGFRTIPNSPNCFYIVLGNL